MKNSDKKSPELILISEMVDNISKILAGHHPAIQGAVIGEVIATYIAGHTPSLRQEIFEGLGQLASDLLPQVDRELYGAEGFPHASN